MCLFCKRALLKRRYSAQETYIILSILLTVATPYCTERQQQRIQVLQKETQKLVERDPQSRPTYSNDSGSAMKNPKHVTRVQHMYFDLYIRKETQQRDPHKRPTYSNDSGSAMKNPKHVTKVQHIYVDLYIRKETQQRDPHKRSTHSNDSGSAMKNPKHVKRDLHVYVDLLCT